MTGCIDVKENQDHRERIAERRLSRSWAINNREMEGRERLKREILERFGPPDPQLVAKYRKRASW